ncbi:type II secretion system F family protein [Sebaldella sp. S0638]|uniref:type II secretion system F family protein n=1 Tax=Sebaldella sp. S0638 TaxID=2957809 RepID=UPI0020A014E1|nr:type II secretion system F family protein [Sebaldella sp. S0638]MCP1225166.1 type II secretion system F family protein [Sebaldella sp. S0638]
MKIKFKYLDKSFDQKSSVLNFKNEKEFFHYIKIQNYTLLHHKKIPSWGTRVKTSEFTTFISSLYFLAKADIRIVDALSILAENFSGTLKNNIEHAVTALKEGKKLREGFTFITDDKIFLNTMEIAEESGNILLPLKNLKSKYEFEQELKKEIINLSLYPALVLATSFIIISILFKFVVPKFSGIYNDLNKEIPYLTKVMIKISTLYGKYFLVTSVSAVVLIIFSVTYYKRNKENFERLFIKLPVIKKLYKEFRILYFSQSMSILLNSGVEIIKSIELSTQTAGSLLGRELKILIKKLEQGLSISNIIGNMQFFDNEYKNYILIGEETGNLGFVFSHITDIYFMRIREKTKRFLKILEPVSIIFIAFFIGLIVISVLLPVFRLGENLNI